ncbi:MAG: 2-C-methyl-D-erythritol 4-phosphate cytidylyltransferase [Armatimonadetes bacterium]|nr:2-C-methyl-D-erythritol 4-phosphate cytidylyltransferase [Armatimonadota bacterium]
MGAVVAAAGRGTRLSGPVPKLLLPLGGRTVLERTLAAFEASPRIDEVAVAVDIECLDAVRARVSGKVVAVVPGGSDRRASVAAGLRALPGAGWIIVHDGARPFVTPRLIERVLDAAMGSGAATLALPVTDTLKEVEGDRVQRTVDRRRLCAVQTPQAFRAALLREAHERVPADVPVTDDAELVEQIGMPVTVVPGEPANMKITTPADYELAQRCAGDGTSAAVRVGLGYDVHRLVPDRPLVLGGVRIPHPRGLAGHSDADALVHAVIDALLGAAAQPDIGRFFPPDDPAYRGADSIGLLETVGSRLRAAGWTVVNVDAVVQAETPRLAPYVDAMRQRIAAALEIPAACIGIKATTAEGLGSVGRGHGIAAQAVALIRRTG